MVIVVTMVSSLLYMAFVMAGWLLFLLSGNGICCIWHGFWGYGAWFIVTMVNFIWVEGQLKSIAG